MVRLDDIQVGDLLRFDSEEEYSFRQRALIHVTEIHTGKWAHIKNNHKVMRVSMPGRTDFRGIDLLTNDCDDFGIVSSTQKMWHLVSRIDD
jgi:hypothetical protein